MLGNIYLQVFCIPTEWTIVTLAICFTNTILYPLFKKYTSIHLVSSFINGVSLFVFVYCIAFLERLTLAAPLLILLYGIGLLAFIPLFFFVQLLVNYFLRTKSKTSKKLFSSAFLLCCIVFVFVGWQYRRAISYIDDFEKSKYTVLHKNFMTEKILGMHFIYHTRFCDYDGWRPPKHDPVLILGMWLNNRIDPLKVSLEKRLELYKKFFPNNKYKFDCSCAVEYSDVYIMMNCGNECN